MGRAMTDTKAIVNLNLQRMFAEITNKIQFMYRDINTDEYLTADYKQGYSDALGTMQRKINAIYINVRNNDEEISETI